MAIEVPFEDMEPAGGNTIGGVGAINVIYGAAETTFLNSGLSAKVPPGGSKRTDQFWTQNTADIEDFLEFGDSFAYMIT